MLQEAVAYCRKFGAGFAGTPGEVFYGALLISRGRMAEGLKLIEEALQTLLENQCKKRDVHL
jgi:hypothetical protein